MANERNEPADKRAHHTNPDPTPLNRALSSPLYPGGTQGG
jgi:hypothetical protein